LEALVFGARIAEDINNIIPHSTMARPANPMTEPEADMHVLAPMTEKLRNLMSRHVGVVREAAGLIHTLYELERLQRAAQGAAPFANMVLAAQFITMAALQREESRGGHARSDYPETRPTAHSVLTLSGLNDAYDALPAQQTDIAKAQ